MEAVIGLVGVIIGALLSGGTTWVMTARAEKRKARAAARLLEAELGRVNQALDGLLGTSRDTSDSESAHSVLAAFGKEQMLRGLTLDRWLEYQGLLAEVLSDDNWYRVSRAYSAFPDLKNLGELRIVTDETRDPDLRRQGDELLLELREIVDAGARVLSRLAGTEIAARNDDELVRRA